MGSGNYGTGKNEKLRRELMVVLMGRYENILSSINHEEWPEAELQGMALSILDSLADLMKRRELSEVVYALEMCGILGRKEALHYIGEGRAQQVIKEATGLLQSLPTLPVLPYLGSLVAQLGAKGSASLSRNAIPTAVHKQRRYQPLEAGFCIVKVPSHPYISKERENILV